MNDSSTEERLALIAEGSTLTLEQAVRELLAVADDAMRSSSGVKRPDEAHGGAYLSRWRFARLRNALGSCPPAPSLAEKIAALKGFEVRSLGDVWKAVWARSDAGFEDADEAVRERLRELLGLDRGSPRPTGESGAGVAGE